MTEELTSILIMTILRREIILMATIPMQWIIQNHMSLHVNIQYQLMVNTIIQRMELYGKKKNRTLEAEKMTMTNR